MPDGMPVSYTTKELLEQLGAKIDQVDQKVDTLLLREAQLPAIYQTRSEAAEQAKRATQALRWSITSLIAGVGAVGTIIGVFIA